MSLSDDFKHRDLVEKKMRHGIHAPSQPSGNIVTAPRDGDHDGFIYDGTRNQKPAPPKHNHRDLLSALEEARRPRELSSGKQHMRTAKPGTYVKPMDPDKKKMDTEAAREDMMRRMHARRRKKG